MLHMILFLKTNISQNSFRVHPVFLSNCLIVFFFSIFPYYYLNISKVFS